MATKPTKPKPSSMPRKKVNLALIDNEATRKASFAKRCKGLMKKIIELTTVCHVPACTIILAPHEPKPDVWPSMDGVMEVLRRFKSLPKMMQSKNMTKRERFLQEQVENVHEQLRKQETENDELRLKLLLHENFAKVVLQNQDCRLKDDYFHFDGKEMMQKPYVMDGGSIPAIASDVTVALIPKENYWLNFAKEVLQNMNSGVTDESKISNGLERTKKRHVMNHGRTLPPKGNEWLNFAKEVLQSQGCGWTDGYMSSGGHVISVSQVAVAAEPWAIDGLDVANEVPKVLNCGEANEFITSCRREMMQQPYHLDHGSTWIGTDSQV